MSIIYSDDIVQFMEQKKIGIGRVNKKSRESITANVRGIRRFRGTWVWTLLTPAKWIYRYAKLFINVFRTSGPMKAVTGVWRQKSFSKKYIQSLFPAEEERVQLENHVFSKAIKFSILVPLFNTPEKYLRDMIESVQNQTYKNWELCLADASDGEHSYVGQVCKEYYGADQRIRYHKLEKNMGISENTNVCIQMAEGDYIALFDHDDILCPTALYENMKMICDKDADFIYSDEATFNGEDIFDIITYHFKPDFAIDNLRANNYICHFSVFSKSLINEVGMFSTEYDGSQDHDMILKLTKAAKHIEHIPKILYLWRSHKNSVSQDINSKTYAIDAGKRAVRDSIERDGMKASVESSPAFPTIYKINYELVEHPKVSIIIPNKDSLQLLSTCVDSIVKKSTYDNYEIIIVENNSTEDEIFEYYKLLDELEGIRVITYQEKFNYSKINNFAVQYAKGDQLLFLNNDIEIITPEWIEELLMYAQRSDVGAVGAKLYYGDNRIQHNGVIIGAGPDGIAIHSHAGESRAEVGYMGRLYFAQNVSAVTAACMMMPKAVFMQIDGFDENLAVAYNDVDLCLKVRKEGYLVVINPFAEAYHYESISRGYEAKRENQERFRNEVAYMKKKWERELEAGDPFYNPNVSKMRPWKFGIDT